MSCRRVIGLKYVQLQPFNPSFCTSSLTIFLRSDVQVTYGLGAQAVRGTSTPMTSSGTSIATATVNLDAKEYFTKIAGATLMNSGSSLPVRVASLTFTTNKRVYGPFGVPTTDRPFEVLGPVYAFHGAVARGSMPESLTAIGFWKVPVTKQL
jgi:hypothetical protein